MTLVLVSKPSISTRIWLSVCSRSSCEPPRPAPRWRPTASISSTKTMQGLLRLAWSKRSRTRLAPTPTNISTNSEPEMLKKGTPASPATARARSVLPVPGGPTRSTPRGMRAPSELNFSGYLRNSTTSCSSVLASSTPATSEKVMTVLLPRNIRARLLPKLMAWLLLPCAWRNMNHRKTPMSRMGKSMETSRPRNALPSSAGSPRNSIVSQSGPAAQAALMSAWTDVVNCAGTKDSDDVVLAVLVRISLEGDLELLAAHQHGLDLPGLGTRSRKAVVRAAVGDRVRCLLVEEEEVEQRGRAHDEHEGDEPVAHETTVQGGTCLQPGAVREVRTGRRL